MRSNDWNTMLSRIKKAGTGTGKFCKENRLKNIVEIEQNFSIFCFDISELSLCKCCYLHYLYLLDESFAECTRRYSIRLWRASDQNSIVNRDSWCVDMDLSQGLFSVFRAPVQTIPAPSTFERSLVACALVLCTRLLYLIKVTDLH